MKKTLAFILIALLSIFTLSACDFVNNIVGKADFEVEGVKGHTDALIDGSTRTISFSVSSAVNEFDLADIIIPSNTTIKAYSDETELTSILSLVEGDNTFKIIFTVASSALGGVGENLNIDALSNSSSYEWTLIITKLSGIKEKTITSIEIVELKNEYAKDENFGSDNYIKVNYDDGTSETINITSIMIEGFDTATTGEKTLKITYNGVSIEASYKVVNKEVAIKSIQVYSMDKNYKLNDAYKGISIKVIMEDDSEKIVEINENNIKGFNTSTIGQKEIEISYNGLTIKSFIFVSDDESNLSEDSIKYSYSFIESLIVGKLPTKDDSSYFDECNAEYDNLEDENKKEVKQILLDFGINDTEVEFIRENKDLITEHFNAIYKIIEQDDENSHIELYEYITLDVAKDIKEFLVKALDILSSDQIEQIVLKVEGENSIEVDWIYQENNTFVNSSIDINEYIEYFRNSNDLEDTNLLDVFNDEGINEYYLSLFAPILSSINSVLNISDKEFYNLIKTTIKGALIFSGEDGYEFTKEDVKEIVDIVNNITKNLKESGSARELIDAIIECIENESVSTLSSYYGIFDIVDFINFLYENYDYLNILLDNITLDDCEYYANLLNSIDDINEDDAFKAIVVFSKSVKKVTDEFKKSLSFAEKIKHFMTMANMNNSIYDDIIEYVDEVSKYDINNLTDENKEFIISLFSYNFSSSTKNEYIRLDDLSNNIIVPLDTDEDQFFEILNSSLKVLYFRIDPETEEYICTAILLDKTNVRNYDLDNEGTHEFEIVVGDATYTYYYLLAGENTFDVYYSDYIISNINDYLFVVNKGEHNLYDYAYYKNNFDSGNYYNESNRILDNIRILYRYKNLKIQKYLSLTNELVNIDSSTCGLKLGTVKVTGIFGEIIDIPIQVLVVDFDNNLVTSVVPLTDENVELMDDGTYLYYIELGNEYFDFFVRVNVNYGVQKQYINIDNQNCTITGIDFNKEGIQVAHIVYEDIEFDINVCVMELNALLYPYNMHYYRNIGDVYNLWYIWEINSILDNERIFFKCDSIKYPNGKSYKYQDMKDFFEEYYGEEIEFRFETDFVNNPELIEELFTGNIIIYGKTSSKVLDSFSYDYTHVEEDHLSDLDNYLRVSYYSNSAIIVDSFDEIDVETLLSYLDKIYASYKYVYSDHEFTVEEAIEFAKENNSYFKIEYNEVDQYFRRYNLYYVTDKEMCEYYLVSFQICTREYADKIISIDITSTVEPPLIVNEISDSLLIDYLQKYYYAKIVYGGYTKVLVNDELKDFLSKCNFEFEYDLELGTCFVYYSCEEFKGQFSIPYLISIADCSLGSCLDFTVTDKTTDLLSALKENIQSRYNHFFYQYSINTMPFIYVCYSEYMEIYNDYNWFRVNIDDFLNNLKLKDEKVTLNLNEINCVVYLYRDMEFSVNIACYSLADIDNMGINIDFNINYIKADDFLTVDEFIDQSLIYYYDAYGNVNYLSNEEKDYLFKEIWKFNLIEDSIYDSDGLVATLNTISSSKKDDICYFEINNGSTYINHYYYNDELTNDDILYNAVKSIYVITNSEEYYLINKSEIIDFLETCTIETVVKENTIQFSIEKNDFIQYITVKK